LWSTPRVAEALIPNAALSGPGTNVNPVLSPESVDADPASLLISNSSDVIFSSFISRFIISSRVISCEFGCVNSIEIVGELRVRALYHRIFFLKFVQLNLHL
jgi:hypothetical protein